jgi:hypothetical protein
VGVTKKPDIPKINQSIPIFSFIDCIFFGLFSIEAINIGITVKLKRLKKPIN